MFAMDVPYAPVQQAPIVLAQSAAAGSGAGTQQPDYLLIKCGEIESVGDPRSAGRAVDPAFTLALYLEQYTHRTQLIDPASIKTTLLEDTSHGKIIAGKTNDVGRTVYRYDVEPNYVGNDRAVFMAEFEGKRYKVVIVLHVFAGAAPGDSDDPSANTCPPPKLIKVTKPSSGASSYGTDSYTPGSVTVTFGDLAGAAVGQTTRNAITLDTNAAGNGWFVDNTPTDNSEFLPTADPTVWKAKAGSAAAGKMDMLSVLLHEN